MISQNGTGSTAKIGINTITPATMLDVKGGSTIRGTLSLPATGAATVGKNSQPLNLAARLGGNQERGATKTPWRKI